MHHPGRQSNNGQYPIQAKLKKIQADEASPSLISKEDHHYD